MEYRIFACMTRSCIAVCLLLLSFGCPAQDGQGDSGDPETAENRPKGGVDYKVELEGQSVPCWPEAEGASNRACRPVASCPSPNNARDPVVACHQPQWVFRTQDPVVHLYGEYLVTEDGPPALVAYRDTDTSGPMAQVTKDVNVHSACHVSFKLSIKGMMGLACGDSVEFRLVRQPREPDEPRSATIMSDWRTFKVTEKPEDSE